jgi:hypothetical protein
MTHEEAWRVAREWCEAWNRRDLDAIMQHYADDIELCSPTIVRRWGNIDGWLRGKAKLRENFAIGVMTPDLHFDLVDVLLGVNALCIVYRRETGALVSDTIELNEMGQARRVVACYGK